MKLVVTAIVGLLIGLAIGVVFMLIVQMVTHRRPAASVPTAPPLVCESRYALAGGPAGADPISMAGNAPLPRQAVYAAALTSST